MSDNNRPNPFLEALAKYGMAEKPKPIQPQASLIDRYVSALMGASGITREQARSMTEPIQEPY